ncbi:MAG: hypothetical protein UR25_C0001G0045 [Candidatus Nomurabacteria bacterium GW2011_GWE1_32_28]|uniref:Uncharacterized protein n=1 Tax=Candidatus Nomurabacteria bacterium GW2011_GWF1_31_48 TaxID=1618767 RepID=A0A0G0AT98_9BACT|nr:MAG: hypothetical protein UR10_C0005G0003 [Candidatus Nomurabacteria bacterium GW2011_GWF2_30_133]KKP28355.1 MAG: hypothetical protein UR18_C0005G0003 [Candidatus Nomurabacteria bacterium GW2011_GWE2_31_40]KKP29940.1 MAG: hypothetical protein UR19_C0006G0003 [Candidatus Nomurabacteria bacterium GW2011_GWF1_31_48]KKP35133.1 MAG: hypothetical protein UR25_C0001G0045 [Candidatus Nomurabacteria bacterium GW2011_GWE1_32_28]HAS80945.1 hypothetical protein [Candidatus Nomurabacteria bacterium]
MDKNNDLVRYISNEQAKGTSVEVIKNSLLSIGWKEEQFSSYFLEQPIIRESTQTQSIQETPIKSKHHLGKKILFIVLILFLLICGASIYYFRNDLKKDLINLPIIKDIFFINDFNQQSNIEMPYVNGSFKILSPIAGETYIAGQTITINWTPGTPGLTYINFYKSDNSYSTMAKPQNNPDTSGSMQYTFPVDIPLGQYKIYAFYTNTLNGVDETISLFDSGEGRFNIITDLTTKVAPVVQNDTVQPVLNKTSFTDCGEANYDIKANNLENNLNSMSIKSVNAFKCFSSIIEFCENGTFSMLEKDKDSVSVSSKGDLCYLNFKMAGDKKTYDCSYPKILPSVFFKAIYSDPENISSEEEKKISKGVSFEMALLFGIAMNTPKDGIWTIDNFYGSKVTCKEI